MSEDAGRPTPPAPAAVPRPTRAPGPPPARRGSGTPGSLAFHRLARLPGVRRRRVVLAALLGLLLYVAVTGAGVLVLVAVDGLSGADLSGRLDALDLTDPLTFLLAYASIAVLLPVVLLVRRWAGPRPVGLVASVAGRLRWRWLARALVLAGVVHVVSLGAQLLVDLGGGAGVPRPLASAWVFLVAAVLLVPVQSAAEEYVFRGVLMQTVGSWLRHPAFAILLPVPLFVLGHGYDLWGQLDIAFFAVVAGWITWRTGGLEAAIALHVVNNSLLTVLAGLGWVDPNAVDGSPLGLLVSVLTVGVSAVLLVRAADRHGVARVRPVRPPHPAGPLWPPRTPTAVPPAPGPG